MSLYVGTKGGKICILKGSDPAHSCEVIRAMSRPSVVVEEGFCSIQDGKDQLAKLLDKKTVKREVQLEFDF
ncbi:MAG: hypothetical protein GY928_39565 [Colwellia sp.]|nr:hypothetical protein [Colwellia sp.]